MDVYLVAVTCCVGIHICASELRIDVTQSSVDVEHPRDVTVRCSLELDHPQTDHVYSMMIKRRGKTICILNDDDTIELLVTKYKAEGTLTLTGAILELTVSNVTCEDRGDYSCKVATRLSLNLGFVSKPLRIIGNPDSNIEHRISPLKLKYDVDDKVKLTCAKRRKTNTAHWSWPLSDISNTNDKCVYEENLCVYMCESCIEHVFKLSDFRNGIRCGIDGIYDWIKVDPKSLSSQQDRNVFMALEAAVTSVTSTATSRMEHPVTQREFEAVVEYEDPIVYETNESPSDDWVQNIWIMVTMTSIITLVLVMTYVIVYFIYSGPCRYRRQDRKYYHGIAQHEVKSHHRERVLLIPVRGDSPEHQLAKVVCESQLSRLPTQSQRTNVQINAPRMSTSSGHINIQKGRSTVSLDHVYDEIAEPSFTVPIGQTGDSTSAGYLTCIGETCKPFQHQMDDTSVATK